MLQLPAFVIPTCILLPCMQLNNIVSALDTQTADTVYGRYSVFFYFFFFLLLLISLSHRNLRCLETSATELKL